MAEVREVIVGNMSWLAQDERNRYLTVHYSSSKIRNHSQVNGGVREPKSYVSHGSGSAFVRGSRLEVVLLEVLFSDRSTEPRNSSAFQPFDRNHSDTCRLLFDQSGRTEIVLESWGDTVVPVRELAAPRDEFITGIAQQSNGTAVVTFLFVRGVRA